MILLRHTSYDLQEVFQRLKSDTGSSQVRNTLSSFYDNNDNMYFIIIIAGYLFQSV